MSQQALDEFKDNMILRLKQTYDEGLNDSLVSFKNAIQSLPKEHFTKDQIVSILDSAIHAIGVINLVEVV